MYNNMVTYKIQKLASILFLVVNWLLIFFVLHERKNNFKTQALINHPVHVTLLNINGLAAEHAKLSESVRHTGRQP